MSSDETIQARPGDELPAELVQYVADLLGYQGPCEIRQFPGGYSNLTYRLSWSGETVVLRRPPRGAKAHTAHDMGREFKVLSLLHPHLPVCPKALHLCEDEARFGFPFYLMEHVEGLILRRDLPADFPLDADTCRRQHEASLRLQAQLHQLDYQALGLSSLGQPEGYALRQVQGWSKRYRAALTEDAPSCEAIMQWLAEAVAKLPASQGAFLHNDYKLDNIVFDRKDPTRIRAVLDWEMATLGDPLMDLGNSLAYWVEASDPASMQAFRTLPSLSPGYLTRGEQVRFYQSLTGCSLEHWNFYASFGLFRLAVIAQQIYQRFKTGFSQDPRFGAMIHGVKALERACAKNIGL